MFLVKGCGGEEEGLVPVELGHLPWSERREFFADLGFLARSGLADVGVEAGVVAWVSGQACGDTGIFGKAMVVVTTSGNNLQHF